MLRAIVFLFLLNNVFGEEELSQAPDYRIQTRNVVLDDGEVSGEKYWDGDFYEFYGIPYATAPTGRHKFKPPLPVRPWDGVFEAKQKRTVCPQTFYTGEEAEKIYLSGEEDCLIMNLMVPKIASEDNLVPVVVYIHSGAFAAGNANMAKYTYLARHDIIVVSFNYRLGAIGFACLGNEDIPGNAGLKDAVAALRWINKNIKKFGGNPNRVTLAGFSVGATIAELLVLSKSTAGLIDKLILESGSALSSYAINRDPVSTAKNIAVSVGYNGTGEIKDLTEFYLTATPDLLAARSLNFFLTNSTFGYAPCIEDPDNKEPFLTESPLEIFKRGDYPKIAVLTGIASMEGLSRIMKFDTWSELMNRNFQDFIPADITFDNDKSRDDTIKDITNRYFNGELINEEKLQGYVDYFSDIMFRYPIFRSTNFHADHSVRPVYFYEFSFVGTLSTKHNYMDKINGACHRDQSSYILDFFGFTTDHDDMFIRDRMTIMWADFITYEDPTAYESDVVNYKWLPYKVKQQNYLSINMKSEMKKDIFVDGYQFWKKIYDKYYWTPTQVINKRKKQK